MLRSFCLLPVIASGPVAIAQDETDEKLEEVFVTGSYSATTLGLGKGYESLREIPQSITVITSQIIKDQNMLTLNDAMKSATGVTVKSYGSGTSGFLLRGFELDSISLDGVRSIGSAAGTHGHGAPDLFFFEQVEVIRGPAGLLEGAGEPGGYINLARKKAKENRSVSLKGLAHSWPGYRAEVDATGALTGDGKLRGRAAVGYEDSDSYIDNIDSQRKMLYSTLEYDATESLSFAIGALIDDQDIIPDVGVPVNNDGTFADIDREIYTGSPFNFKESKLSRQFFETKYQFNSGTTIAFTLNNLDRNFEYLLNYTTTPLAPPSGETSRWALSTDQELSEQSFDLHANIPFFLFGQEHRVLIGANGREAENYTSGFALDFTYPSIDVFDPSSAENPDPADTLTQFRDPSTTDSKENGLYFKSVLGLTGSTDLILGGRLTNEWETKTDDGSPASKIENEFTPYFGLVQEISQSANVYFSVTESFVPQEDRDVNDNVIDPRTGQQYEFGLKGELNEGQGNYHVAIFQITEDNRAIEDLENPGFAIAGGEVKSEGFEAEISGNVSENLKVLAGYAYTDTEFVESDDPAEEGTRFSTDTPEHSLKLWGTYNISSDFYFGLGAEYGSGVFAEQSDVRWEDDGYTIFSMMAAYELNDRVKFIVNGTNLTDAIYYSRVQGGGRQNYFGEPRQFKLSVEASF